MTTKEISLKQALNKAYRLIKPKRSEIEVFKKNLIILLGQIDKKESEENVKIHLMNFLRDTFYNPNHLLATKGRTDFVVHTGKGADTPAGVLFEVKRPLNTSDMVTKSNINSKAMHELMLYYLRERIEHKNNDVRQLVITNIYEWFIFDASTFERLFHKNGGLIKQYREWSIGQKVSTSTDLFYTEIAKPFLATSGEEIPFTWFDIRDFEKPLKNTVKEDDKKLITLFKVFSPTHLLKLPFANDSNSLDKGFYSELLHIIGLEEVKENSKKIIRRKQSGSRNEGSLLENTITILETENCLYKVVDLKSYGEIKDEQLFSVGLELCITWVNRILFLKLLEAQLLKYHKGDNKYRFLNFVTLPQYDEVYKLFFQVLARKHEERTEKVQKKFNHIPYLNSSLFEFSDMEESTIKINMLDDAAELELFPSTKLRNRKDKPRADKLNTLQYLFEFLNAYDFASEGEEDIQEEDKPLINASVLGLIFEKINGYKDGSIFTPGFVTMYMCRESIRQSVANKFKETYSWKADNFTDLRNYISEDRSAKTMKEYNDLINRLTICDPAVGSGHFLVSALNELIAIKSELGILIDDHGVRLKDIEIVLENDELIVTDEQGDIFQYIIEPDKNNNYYIQPWKQTVQKTLFHEKQTIIESCLFGVDINPKSVQICRLRLWIELLKNAYYIVPGDQSQNSGRVGNELQTLPNIDINIKCGNSLISRFSITEDLKSATSYFEKKILEYKQWVADYKHEVDKDKKRGIQQLMTELKKGFLSKITDRNPTKVRLNKLSAEFLNKYVNEKLFSSNLTLAQKKDKERLDKEIAKLNQELEAYIKNPIFSNSFEWRFEFPEVLNEKGDFVGFDVIIGNPPYIVMIKSLFGDPIIKYVNGEYTTAEYNPNTYTLFVELSLQRLLKPKGLFALIIPNTWLDGKYFTKMRDLLDSSSLTHIANLKNEAFEEIVETVVIIGQKSPPNDKPKLKQYFKESFVDYDFEYNSGINPFNTKVVDPIVQKIEAKTNRLKDYALVYRGVETKDNSKWLSENQKPGWEEILLGKDIHRYSIEYSGSCINFIPKEMKSNANESLYRKPKILMRRTGNSIIAAIDLKKRLALKNLYLIIPEDDNNIFAILGQLNSSLFAYYHIAKTSGENKAFAQFPGHYIEDFPCRIDQSISNKISDLIEKIINIKENDPSFDTKNLEKEIDELVYQLFEITQEEVKIIEDTVR